MSMKYVMDLHAKIMQMRTKKDNANENKGHRACSKWTFIIS